MSQASTITVHIYDFTRKINCTLSKPVIEYQSQEIAKVIYM